MRRVTACERDQMPRALSGRQCRRCQDKPLRMTGDRAALSDCCCLHVRALLSKRLPRRLSKRTRDVTAMLPIKSSGHVGQHASGSRCMGDEIHPSIVTARISTCGLFMLQVRSRNGRVKPWVCPGASRVMNSRDACTPGRVLNRILRTPCERLRAHRHRTSASRKSTGPALSAAARRSANRRVDLPRLPDVILVTEAIDIRADALEELKKRPLEAAGAPVGAIPPARAQVSSRCADHVSGVVRREWFIDHAR